MVGCKKLRYYVIFPLYYISGLGCRCVSNTGTQRPAHVIMDCHLCHNNVIGCSPFLNMDSHPTCLLNAHGSKANSSSEKVDSFIGKLSVGSSEVSDYQPLGTALDLITQKQPDQMPQIPMSGKIKVALTEPDLKLEKSVLNEIHQLTGSKFETWPGLEISMLYQVTFSCVVITNSVQLAKIIVDLMQWNGLYTSTGAQVVQANLDEHGNWGDQTHILKIPTPNFGTVIKGNQLLSWMNFEAKLISATSYAGSIDILVGWKSKDQVCR